MTSEELRAKTQQMRIDGFNFCTSIARGHMNLKSLGYSTIEEACKGQLLMTYARIQKEIETWEKANPTNKE